MNPEVFTTSNVAMFTAVYRNEEDGILLKTSIPVDRAWFMSDANFRATADRKIRQAMGEMLAEHYTDRIKTRLEDQ